MNRIRTYFWSKGHYIVRKAIRNYGVSIELKSVNPEEGA